MSLFDQVTCEVRKYPLLSLIIEGNQQVEYKEIQEKVCNKIKSMEEEIATTNQELVRIPSAVGYQDKARVYMENLYPSIGPVSARYREG